MERMDFVQNGYSGTIFLVTQAEGGLTLWDFQAWLKGYYDAYIPLSAIDPLDYKVIGNIENNPELLPNECDGYNGEPHAICVDTIFKNPAFNPEYAVPHKYEHSIGYPEDKHICVCGEARDEQIHIC